MLKEIEAKVNEIVADSQKGLVKESELEVKVNALNKQIAEKLDDNGRKDLKDLVDQIAKQRSIG